MIQQALRQVDFSVCSEAALTLFFIVFVAVTLRTLLTDRKKLQQFAANAIQDHQEPLE